MPAKKTTKTKRKSKTTASKKKTAASKKKKAPAKKKTASKKPATKMYGVRGTKAEVRRTNAYASRCRSGMRATGNGVCPSGYKRALNNCCVAIDKAQKAVEQLNRVSPWIDSGLKEDDGSPKYIKNPNLNK